MGPSMNRKTKALEFVDSEYHIHITGRHLQVTEPMKDYAMEKLTKIERFMHRIIDIYVTMDIQKLDNRVEIILKAGNVKITSQAATTDMYVSIDKAVDKLEAQILKYKSRQQDHHTLGHAELNSTANAVESASQTVEEDFDIEDEVATSKKKNNFVPRIVREDACRLKILTFEEAMRELDVTGKPFLLFKNEADQKLKLMYRLEDENFGVLEPSC